jgi:GNAT superfamily N-acetyltransferase
MKTKAMTDLVKPSMLAPAVIRRARPEDAEKLRDMHRLSLRGMGRSHYSPLQVEGFLQDVDTVDDGILSDGTFFVAELDGRLLASGAWTLRLPAYMSRLPAAVPEPAPPRRATIRSVFTHPDFVRRGLASRIMRLCEEEAVIHGLVTRIELHATLPAVPLYRSLGYRPEKQMHFPLSNGERFAAIFMIKSLASAAQAA